MTVREKGFADPIVAGFGLGLVLLASILVAGRGLGASGAFATAAAAAVQAVAPSHAASQPYLAKWVPTNRGGLFGDWLVLELLGAIVGAWASARFAGRRRTGVESVGGEAVSSRLVSATVGGALMGAGARLARGCTSGLGLTGGALLVTGAWLFIPVAFATAFLVAYLRRRWPRAAPAIEAGS